MTDSTIRAFIQARMSSSRFPGKVLAPLNGQPIIWHVINRVSEVIPAERIVVATSVEQSDDPLAAYLGRLGVSVHRGALDNVFERFQSCLSEYPCSWFFRICADSPLLDSSLLKRMMDYSGSEADLVTNVQVRSFPKGRSLEMIRAGVFARIDSAQLRAEEVEHLTKVFYAHADKFKIINIESGDPELAKLNYAVDTLEDLFRLEDVQRLEQAISQSAQGFMHSTA